MTTSPLGTVNRTDGRVHLERLLPASIAEVWDAVTDPARLQAWLAPVEAGAPATGRFVLRMNDTETATCTVTGWEPPRLLRLTWDYTGEGPSELRLELSEAGSATRLCLTHERIPVDPIQYGAGWHVHLDRLLGHLGGTEGAASGCAGDDFMSAYRAIEPHYAAAATG